MLLLPHAAAATTCMRGGEEGGEGSNQVGDTQQNKPKKLPHAKVTLRYTARARKRQLLYLTFFFRTPVHLPHAIRNVDVLYVPFALSNVSHLPC